MKIREIRVIRGLIPGLICGICGLALALASPVGAQTKSVPELSRAGWDALNAGRIPDAAAAFAEALKRRPTDPQLLLGAGVAAHLSGRADEARQALSDALRMDPSLTSASLLLGEVLYRGGDLDGAILVYEQALANAPGNAQIARRLDAWRREAALHGRFGQRLGDHFTVMFEGPAESALADKAVALLEAAYWRIGTALNTYPADVVTVVLYTREQFRDITQSPAWAGGAFDGRIRVPVQGALQNPREFERVLTHEFTHALVRGLAPRGVPTWLNEGIAVVFEGSSAPPREEQLRAAKKRIPLATLERSFGALGQDEAVLAYAESAAAVQAMLDLGGPAAIAGVLTDIGRGLPFPEAFERNMLISYDEFKAAKR
jgi:tetratricopeptide (TPR) repeat protein